MRHQTSRDSANRHGNSMSRTAIEKVDDTKFIQEQHHRVYHGEQHEDLEHYHPYGYSAVVQQPTGKGKFRQAAESVLTFLGANRSHGVSIVNADRRYRLYKLKDGEVALHDDQGQQVHITRSGIVTSAPKSKNVVHQIMSDDGMPQDPDQQPQGDGQKLGQIAQSGRSTICTVKLDKDGLTIDHPNGTVTTNSKEVVINNSDKITMKSKSMDVEAPDVTFTANDVFKTIGKTWLDDGGDPPKILTVLGPAARCTAKV